MENKILSLFELNRFSNEQIIEEITKNMGNEAVRKEFIEILPNLSFEISANYTMLLALEQLIQYEDGKKAILENWKTIVQKMKENCGDMERLTKILIQDKIIKAQVEENIEYLFENWNFHFIEDLVNVLLAMDDEGKYLEKLLTENILSHYRKRFNKSINKNTTRKNITKNTLE